MCKAKSFTLGAVIVVIEHFGNQFLKLRSRAAEQFLAGRGDTKILAAFSILNRCVADKVPAGFEAMEDRVERSGPQIVSVVTKFLHDLDPANRFFVRVIKDVQSHEAREQMPQNRVVRLHNIEIRC